MCECNTNLDLSDDSRDGDVCCPECLEEFNESMAPFEPADQPVLEPLIPETAELPIEINKPHAQNVLALVKGFAVTVGYHQHKAVVVAPVTEADVLAALKQSIRGFAQQTVIARQHVNAEAAVANKVLIIHTLETLIDEILYIDLPAPKVN